MEVVGASFSNLLRISSNTTEKHIRLYASALLYVKWTYSSGTKEKPLVFHTAYAACQLQKNSLCCVRLLICRMYFFFFLRVCFQVDMPMSPMFRFECRKNTVKSQVTEGQMNLSSALDTSFKCQRETSLNICFQLFLYRPIRPSIIIHSVQHKSLS